LELRRRNPEILVLGYRSLEDTSEVLGPPQLCPRIGRISKRDAVEKLEFAPWSRIYRRDYLTRIGATFPAGRYEDLAVFLEHVAPARLIVGCPGTAYIYRIRNGSTMTSLGARTGEVLGALRHIVGYPVRTLADYRGIERVVRQQVKKWETVWRAETSEWAISYLQELEDIRSRFIRATRFWRAIIRVLDLIEAFTTKIRNRAGRRP
jgi:hypothetical protein